MKCAGPNSERGNNYRSSIASKVCLITQGRTKLLEKACYKETYRVTVGTFLARSHSVARCNQTVRSSCLMELSSTTISRPRNQGLVVLTMMLTADRRSVGIALLV